MLTICDINNYVQAFTKKKKIMCKLAITSEGIRYFC